MQAKCPRCGQPVTVPGVAGQAAQPQFVPPGGMPPTGAPRPHRGPVILTLGILGLVVCWIVGIVAWVMGNSDLREMAAGRMDRSGEGMTRAGKICGILSLVTVIAMAGILASMIIPSAMAVRERARRAMCMSNLREIGKGLTLYSGDFNDYYPCVREPGSTASRPMASLALLYDQYVSSKKVFVCPSTTDSCEDLQPGQTFQAHGAPTTPGNRRQCSYGYDDTRGVNTTAYIVIAADAPPAASGEAGLSRNSDNHQGTGQNVLFYGGDTVIWTTTTRNPMNDTDDIYTPSDPQNPGVSDSYVHQ